MPAPYLRLSSEEFASLLSRFPFRRRIDAVHLHHTWRPRHQDYRGHDTIVAMANHHMQVNGWSDIAQHVSIGPRGEIWTGRDWNRAPASSSGYNGNAQTGPFMIEMIGDFDAGRDRLEKDQRAAVIDVIAHVQRHFGLAPDALRFHNQMSGKTCPGTSVDRDAIVAEVADRHAKLQSPPRRAGRAVAPSGFGDDADSYYDFVVACARSRARDDEQGSAEPAEHAMSADEQRRYDSYVGRVQPAPMTTRAVRGPAAQLTPDVLRSLRPHVVNMVQGRFSPTGLYSSTSQDVDAIFETHLVQALAEAKAKSQPLRVVFYAHGGLVNEAAGLWMAARLIPWWRANGIYPIYFVWETGLLETLGQLLGGAASRAARRGRDVADHTSDPVLETLARTLRGDLVWGGMKLSAERAAAPGGAGRHVAERLATFCQAHAGDVELHAVGHSAGAIFHAHFIPAAVDHGLKFETASFLAPALRVDTFLDRLAPRVESGDVRRLDVFTMAKDWEKSDHCMNVYRKSLLYLIHYALEPERKEPILGLEVSLRENDRLRALFGLDGAASGKGEVIWAKSTATEGASASCSTSHGGFDNDAPTLASVVRRILGGGDASRSERIAVTAFPAAAAADRGWNAWPADVSIDSEELDSLLAPPMASTNGHAGPIVASTPSASAATPAGATAVEPAAAIATYTGGRRRALCIGIDAYPDAPLSGCVADARRWSAELQSLGFETDLLLNEQATHVAIKDEIRSRIQTSVAGDVLVIQYSGHGTQLPDIDGDDTDADGKDEAICPYDYISGAFLVDDEFAALFEAIPDDVNVTCFFDSCHSGDVARFAVGKPSASATGKRRYLRATPEMVAAYRGFRERTRGLGAARVAAGRRRAVVYSACRSRESAWEHENQGDFTRNATPMLALHAGRTSHRQFQELVRTAFGDDPQQHPELDCLPALQRWPLLAQIGPKRTAGAAAATPGVPYGGVPSLHGA